MTMFRRRPTLVDAVQWFPDSDVAGVQREMESEAVTIVQEVNEYGVREESRFIRDRRYYVITIQGQRAYLTSGDWVIAESKPGRYYPCSAEVFAATYERVETTP